MTRSDEDAYCALPEAPERHLDDAIDPHRRSLIRVIEKKWVDGTVLHYCFLDEPSALAGSDEQKAAVHAAIREWRDAGLGIRFVHVDDPADAEIRIGFERGASWSYVGRDNIDLEHLQDPRERTMNFGWDLTTPHGRDTALHEIGHALGFPHEHQNPNSGIEWNEAAVYEHFSGAPNFWDRASIFRNVLNSLERSLIAGSQWDKDSIMHYRFAQGLIRRPEEYQSSPLVPTHGLSAEDIARVKTFYPKLEEPSPELKPFESRPIDIAPGEQLNFVIRPERSRRYTIQTFGDLDVVMVIFEDDGTEPRYLTGADDGGSEGNAKLRLRLLRGRTYCLRLRLYFAAEAGTGGVMLW